MLPRMALKPPYDLPAIFRKNLDLAVQHLKLTHKYSDRRIADRAGVDPGTLRKALKGPHTQTLESVQRLAVGVGFEPWQLIVQRFDPAHPPVVRKRGGVPVEPEDQLTELLMATWARLEPRHRVDALSAVQKIETDAEARAAGPPPVPSQASQPTR